VNEMQEGNNPHDPDPSSDGTPARRRVTRMKECCTDCKTYVYNSRSGRICNHTKSGFGFYILFLLVLYAFCAGLFVLMYHCFIVWRLPTDRPYRMGKDGLHMGLIGLFVFPVDKGTTLDTMTLGVEKKDENALAKRLNESHDATLLGDCQVYNKTLNATSFCFYAAVTRLYGWIPPTNSPPALQCNVEKESDKVRLSFFPQDRTYPMSAFPAMNKNWKRPLVAVKVDFLTSDSVEVKVKCFLENAGDNSKFTVGNPQLRRIIMKTKK
jgi:hypothetical protein